MAADYYKILGVPENAEIDEIKRAYRKLAKKHHPDHNKGDKAAEAKFKEISEAYSTLSDKQKRQEYDMLRKYGAFAGGPTGGANFSQFGRAAQGGFGAHGFDFSDFTDSGAQGFKVHFGGRGNTGMNGLEDILSSFFGGAHSAGGASGSRMGPETFTRGRRKAQRGTDIASSITISFQEMISGTERIMAVSGPDGGKKLRVKIPAGIDDGGKIRLRGQGQPGPFGGENGDLIITVRVMPDQQFERKGNDIFSSLEISFVEAIKGCKKNVKTLTKTVALTVPPGTQPGATMRLKGMGLAVGGTQGDLYVEIKVSIPKTLTDKQRRLLEEWEV